MKVKKFEVIDHGCDGSQSFPGCGSAMTEYKECYTGCGDTASVALEDALCIMAQSGFYTITKAQEAQMAKGLGTGKDDSRCDGCATVPGETCDDCDVWHYVSVRVA